MEPVMITLDSLTRLAATLLASGTQVIADAADGTGFRPLRSADELALRPNEVPGKLSFKQALFPKTEPIFFFKKSKDDIEILDPPSLNQPIVILGARPCDASAPEILSRVFNWDYQDEFFNTRMDHTVMIGLQCGAADAFCFCTSVGLTPDSRRGSDLFLIPLASGSYRLEAVTEKGERFLAAHSGLTQPDDASPALPAATPTRRFDAALVKEWIDHNFEHPFWAHLGETCLGCAQCAFVCPTCHCFDIVDEEYSYFDGRRMKNWDACQFGLFTKHASGHNPRDDQDRRYRQRLSHKFAYYPEKFGEILCTGCGRCSRGCAVNMDIGEIVSRIEALRV